MAASNSLISHIQYFRSESKEMLPYAKTNPGILLMASGRGFYSQDLAVLITDFISERFGWSAATTERMTDLLGRLRAVLEAYYRLPRPENRLLRSAISKLEGSRSKVNSMLDAIHSFPLHFGFDSMKKDREVMAWRLEYPIGGFNPTALIPGLAKYTRSRVIQEIEEDVVDRDESTDKKEMQLARRGTFGAEAQSA